jgi:peptidoglycan hydrolase-like protein with peptidoglycan-binding domain
MFSERNIPEYCVIHEGDNFVIVDAASELPTHKNWPQGSAVINPKTHKRSVRGSYGTDRDTQSITELWVHQMASSYTPGFAGIRRVGYFFVRDPQWAKRNGVWTWTGTGRGWPGFAYHFAINYDPPTYNNKPIIWQTQELEIESWHTGGGANRTGVSVGLQGYFSSRHNRAFVPRHGTTGEPSELQLQLVASLWGHLCDYCMRDLKIKGHFDKNKLTCPGDAAELLIRSWRGENVKYLRYGQRAQSVLASPVAGYRRRFIWARRQATLLAAGYPCGTYGPYKNGVDGLYGLATRLAIEDCERDHQLPVDGNWDSTVSAVLHDKLREAVLTDKAVKAVIDHHIPKELCA